MGRDRSYVKYNQAGIRGITEKIAVKQTFGQNYDQWPDNGLRDQPDDFLLSFSGYPFFIRRDYCRDDCEVIETLPEESTFEEKVTAALEEIDSNKRMIYHIYGSSNREFYEKQLMKICDYVTRTYIRSRDYSEKVASKDLEFVISYLKCELFGQLIDWLNHDMSYDLWSIPAYFAECLQEVCVWYVKNIN